jgi:GrpB-like predicted nucleotidyltransferase (UPF0157 family)/RimJ/RimL family protein N-acetyltransferase
MTRAGAVLPERIDGADGLLLRRWTPKDAEALSHAVAESIDHLRPWMGWIAQEPTAIEDRRTRLEEWERDWSRGGDVLLGIFLFDQVIGSCGLHRRIAPDGLEIGYWIHPSFTRRGFATRAAWLLTDAALDQPDISHVEIHHDKANVASAGVPRKLGYQFVEERRDVAEAPADLGVEWRWRMNEQIWRASSDQQAAERTEREDYLDTVLIGGREKRPIVLVEYDTNWPTRFEKERTRIRQALGDGAIRIEHIGSTAVPGLAAKPIIDVLVTIADPDDEERFLPALAAAGYEVRVREPGHRMLRTPSRDVHVHVWRDADPEVHRYLRFRDLLRRSPEDRRAYEQLKRELAQSEWADMNDYADAKGPLIETILARQKPEHRGTQ